MCQDFPSKMFCLTVSKDFVEQPFRVTLISGNKKIMLQTVMSRFLSKFFISQYQSFLRGTFCASLISGIEKVWLRRWWGRGCQKFPSKIFCLTVRERFVGEPFTVSLSSGIEKSYASEGYVTIFRRKFSVPHCRKFS